MHTQISHFFSLANSQNSTSHDNHHVVHPLVRCERKKSATQNYCYFSKKHFSVLEYFKCTCLMALCSSLIWVYSWKSLRCFTVSSSVWPDCTSLMLTFIIDMESVTCIYIFPAGEQDTVQLCHSFSAVSQEDSSVITAGCSTHPRQWLVYLHCQPGNQGGWWQGYFQVRRALKHYVCKNTGPF